jgi:polyribonucleotide nucleotidyltransferase
MSPPNLTGLIVGKKGKTVQGIEKETGTRIQVEPDGLVKIFSPDKSAIEAAKKRIEELITLPEVGKIYEGKITRIKDLGMFVEILPGKEGFVYSSRASAWGKFNVGDRITVKLLEIDEFDVLQLSEKAAKRELAKAAAL